MEENYDYDDGDQQQHEVGVAEEEEEDVDVFYDPEAVGGGEGEGGGEEGQGDEANGYDGDEGMNGAGDADADAEGEEDGGAGGEEEGEEGEEGEEDEDGVPKKGGPRGKQMEYDDDEDEDEEDEEEEDEDQPRKKKRKQSRRKKGISSFVDLEAEVSEEEDEDLSADEDGALDGNFIVPSKQKRKKRKEGRGGLGAGAGDGEDDVEEGFEDVDAIEEEMADERRHRELDERRRRFEDKDAHQLAKEMRERHRRANRTMDWSQLGEAVPKNVLMPGVGDPSIWGVRCKLGRERDLVMSLSRKAVALTDTARPLEIISAFHRETIKGLLYVEARSEAAVRHAIHGLMGIYSNPTTNLNQPLTNQGVFLVKIEEMPDLLKTKKKRTEVEQGGWVRLRRGRYAGDLAQVLNVWENGEGVEARFVPRIDFTPAENDKLDLTGATKGHGNNTSPLDLGINESPNGRGKKRGRGEMGGTGNSTGPRAPQKFFNVDEVRKRFGHKSVKKEKGYWVFQADMYKDGYLEKDLKFYQITVEDVAPTVDELTTFLGDARAVSGEGSGPGGGPDAVDLSMVAEQARKAQKLVLQPGDHVEIVEGLDSGRASDEAERSKIEGIVESIMGPSNEIVSVIPSEEVHPELKSHPIEVPIRIVRKKFKAGDHVKVLSGQNIDETGLVVKVKDDLVTFLSDMSFQEVTVFGRDVREAAEVGSGANTIGQYELHDMVYLDPQTTGVIFKIDRDTFRILDQTGAVRSLKPTQIGLKTDSKRAVATDHEGFEIRPGEQMKEAAAGGRDVRTGRVLHLYRGMYAFIYNPDLPENNGVFVTYARQLSSVAPKGAGAAAKKPGSLDLTKMNPDAARGAPGANPWGANEGAGGMVGSSAFGRKRDKAQGKRVRITKGEFKGYTGMIKDANGPLARVELHTNNRILTINKNRLVAFVTEPDGTVKTKPLDQVIMGEMFRAPEPPPNNHGPIDPYTNGGKTPAHGGGGRTPAWNPGGKTPAPNSGSKTPHHMNDPWSATAKTPAHPGTAGSWGSSGAAAMGSNSGRSERSPWSASSRTPGPPMDDGGWGRTPNHQSGVGGRTPAPRPPSMHGGWGGNSTRQEPPGSARYTPQLDQNWRSSTATPTWGPAPTTPYDPYVSATTTPYHHPQYPNAPTPGMGPPMGPPPPRSYAAAPTPGMAPTPTGSWAPAGTPSAVAGSTPVGTPYSHQGTPYGGSRYGDDDEDDSNVVHWAFPGLQVLITRHRKSMASFQGGRFEDQKAVITSVKDTAHGERYYNVRLLEAGGNAPNVSVPPVPIQFLEPIHPSAQKGETAWITGALWTGQKVLTLGRDGDEFLCHFENKSTAVVKEKDLCLAGKIG